jgi:hypothetical protein
LNLIRDSYADFGPTLACEKLRECHGLVLSKETVRHLMTEAGLWIPRQQRPPFENYRKEAERLFLCSIVQLDKPLSSLTHEDLLVYQPFLADPQPSAVRVAAGGRKHPRSDARWRPFYGPHSPASQRQAMVILNVMFAWLVQAGYLAGNPLSLSRQRARKTAPRITRYLAPELWQEDVYRIDAARNGARALSLRSCALALYAAVSGRIAHHRGQRQHDGAVLQPARSGRA